MNGSREYVTCAYSSTGYRSQEYHPCNLTELLFRTSNNNGTAVAVSKISYHNPDDVEIVARPDCYLQGALAVPAVTARKHCIQATKVLRFAAGCAAPSSGNGRADHLGIQSTNAFTLLTLRHSHPSRTYRICYRDCRYSSTSRQSGTLSSNYHYRTASDPLNCSKHGQSRPHSVYLHANGVDDCLIRLHDLHRDWRMVKQLLDTQQLVLHAS